MKNVSFSKMDRETKAKYNSVLLRILDKIKSICEDNNIRWFLGYGSCLGAVRHKGIIPWDDDIDICMPRPDYDRFVDICRNSDMGDFEICLPDTTQGHFEYFSRIADKNTTLLFSMARPFVTGVYIDVFPMDGAGDGKISHNYDKFMFWQRIHHFSRSYFTGKTILSWLKKGMFSHILLALGTSVFRKPLQNLSLHRINSVIRKHAYDNSEYAVFYIHVYYMKNVIPRKWINDTIWVPFENTEVPIPKFYNEYLTHLYGDYMTPPPDNKKDDRHVVFFIDLNERLTLEEVKNRLKEEK